MTDPRLRRPRILFVGEAVSLAHVARPLALAQSLDRNRYDIHFACGERYCKLPLDAGLPFHPLPTLAAETVLKRLDFGSPIYDQQTLIRYVESEESLIADLRPDLIVGDFRISLSISAECAQAPYANLCNAHWSPYSTLRFPTPELSLTRMAGPAITGWLIRATESISCCTFRMICTVNE